MSRCETQSTIAEKGKGKEVYTAPPTPPSPHPPTQSFGQKQLEVMKPSPQSPIIEMGLSEISTLPFPLSPPYSAVAGSPPTSPSQAGSQSTEAGSSTATTTVLSMSSSGRVISTIRPSQSPSPPPSTGLSTPPKPGSQGSTSTMPTYFHPLIDYLLRERFKNNTRPLRSKVGEALATLRPKPYVKFGDYMAEATRLHLVKLGPGEQVGKEWVELIISTHNARTILKKSASR
ncbi:hypothetical protein T439DRAFT_80063 [Meredithblackwellia eburnea MCA 4105]